MRLGGKITEAGTEPYELFARPLDIIQWEMGTKRKITDGVGYTDMMRILHATAKREGRTTKGFEDWAGGLEDFSPITDPVDPIQKDQPQD